VYDVPCPLPSQAHASTQLRVLHALATQQLMPTCPRAAPSQLTSHPASSQQHSAPACKSPSNNSCNDICNQRLSQAGMTGGYQPWSCCSCCWPCGHNATMAPPLPVNFAAAPTDLAVATMARLVSPNAASPNMSLHNQQASRPRSLKASALYSCK